MRRLKSETAPVDVAEKPEAQQELSVRVEEVDLREESDAGKKEDDEETAPAAREGQEEKKDNDGTPKGNDNGGDYVELTNEEACEYRLSKKHLCP